MLKLGVVGLGAFGECQIQALGSLPGVTVVAVASRRAERAREIADRYGVERIHGDAGSLCRDPDVEAVCVATEEQAHVAPAIAALEAGKPVLVEKPLASTVADALAIRESVRQTGGLLMPGHIVRFESHFIDLWRRVRAGDLGQVVAIHASRNRPRSTLATYGRCHPALVTAIHDIDAALWILDERPNRVRASHQIDRSEHGRYGVWGTFGFPSGASVSIEATWMLAGDGAGGSNDRFALTGTLGSAQIDMANGPLRIHSATGVLVPELGYQPVGHDGLGGALAAEMAHFVSLAMHPDRRPVVTVDDGVRAVVAAEAMIASATRNEEIEIEWPL